MDNVYALSKFKYDKLNAPNFGLEKIFSTLRNHPQDVMWLKENSEILGILNCSNLSSEFIDLDSYLPFYEGSKRHLNFFRQYYRFILSICLDLEDLGMPGSHGVELAEWIVRSQSPDAELSDLQRAEVRHLLARRGVEVKKNVDSDEQLDERLRQFTERSHHFAIPNRKAAYELTHILFYLSNYGRCDPKVSAATLKSLYFAGTVAYLDQDPDLLSEVCLALNFANSAVPSLWRTWLKTSHRQFKLSTQPMMAGTTDNYHEYFVLNWFLSRVEGDKLFGADYTGVRSFVRARGVSALRGISMALYSMTDSAGSTGGHLPLGGSWSGVRPRLLASLTQTEQSIWLSAEGSIPEFEEFFTAFSRFSDLLPVSDIQTQPKSSSYNGLLPVNV